MALPSWLARFNRRATNRLTRPFAGRLPGFAVLTHAGRTTGGRYHTPVNLFRSDGTYVVALTYGSGRDWVKNVMTARGCVVETRGTVVRLDDPRIVTDAKAGLAPTVLRPLLRLIGVTEFMLLRPVPLEHEPSTDEEPAEPRRAAH